MQRPCAYLFPLIFLLCTQGFAAEAQAGVSPIDRESLYKDLSRDNLQLIDQQLAKVAGSASEDREAFEGTLLMKKSKLTTDKRKQLDLFRTGKDKLERMISVHPDNIEYRFLRLLIQENTPDGFPYRNNLPEDAALIQKQFNQLKPDLRRIIRRYARQSAHLKSLAR